MEIASRTVCLGLTLATTLFSLEARADNYICDIKQVLTLSDDGMLAKERLWEEANKNYSRIGWNTLTGELRFYERDGTKSSFVRELKNIHKGSNQNPAVGTGGANPLSLMTVHTWKKGMPFLLQSYWQVFTGNCILM